jgi:hypothetical protein
MPHLGLVGDGILANGAHAGRNTDSSAVLRQLLPGWTVSLLAAEGATMAAVASQLDQLPQDVDLVVLSAGGNDALKHVELLQQPAKSSAETLDALIAMGDEFAASYDGIMKSLRIRPARAVVCTIYEPPLVGKGTASRARVLLTIVNDHVLRTAYRWGVDVLDLRAICTSPGDFRQQVAPSTEGAAKIARAIAAVAAGTDGKRITVIAG